MLNYELIKESPNPYELMRRKLAPISMQKLIGYIHTCTDCDTASDKKSVCIGNPDANILIITDNATNDKDINNYFTNILNESGTDMEDIFMIPSVCCPCERKVNNNYVYRIPTLQEQSNCKYFLDYAIKTVEPRLIISMGQTPLSQFYSGIKETKLEEEIEKNREKFSQVKNQLKD